MNKNDLIGKVAEMTGLPKSKAGLAVNSAFDCVIEALAKGEKIQLSGFGSFEVRQRAARTVRNPKTNDPIALPSYPSPRFHPSSNMKARVRRDSQ